ncbi:uncharacterized protein [Cicer arietinum]|uniref:Stress response protein nst1-like isoform X2 n=1 Tax=Cicer arietinum TaxID=3827 RepID=A0A3Q7XN73_CICAR|nr:stress response protein nst1-like isoform X2 [Cicer arietinum]
MCILCVIQKCSRRVATMLPWLVIPLIGLWALSQLLPPAFRFEITSPRLACVFVLLVTLFWYEILMPQLSAWRVRRNARLRERKRFEAIELQKLRKTATRRCRNCLNPYRDQNPGGSRFMCSYCGHVSKRPVLDLPGSQELQISNSGIVKDLVGKSGKMLNSKVWSENGWMCSQDWLENGNWVGGSVLGNPINWRMNGSGRSFGGDEHCLSSRSYSSILLFVCRLLASFFLSIRWIWRKIFRISLREERLSDAERRALLAKRGENGENLNESRGERARRKAEEKRQARLERELLEEEERKQREEVAKLVEERRRLRDEIMETEKDSSKLSHTSKEKDRRKEAEKKRQERRKEKDKGSSKSNSDVEELEKRASKESERKRDFDKKSETDYRENQKSGLECGKGQSTYTIHSNFFAANSYNRGSTGTRYLDRMRGTILSSSKALGFGKGANLPATVVKESKSNNSVDHAHTAASKRDMLPPERPTAKSNLNVDDKNINHSVLPEPQPWTAPKKSWQQLFTRSSSVPKSSNSNVICRPNSKIQVETKSPQLSSQSPVAQSFNNPIHFGLPSPFNISTQLNGSTSSSLGFSPAIEPLFSPVVNTSHDFRHDEQELFEDPCYVPDPLSLLGPVSESLDNFQLDLGSGYLKDTKVIKPRCFQNTSGTGVNKPSPIESPLTREKNNCSNKFSSIPQAQDIHAFPLDDAAAIEKGTWHMWSTSPLGPEGLGLVGGPESWLLSSQRNVPTNGDCMLPACQKTMAYVFNNDDNLTSSTHPPQNVFLANGALKLMRVLRMKGCVGVQLDLLATMCLSVLKLTVGPKMNGLYMVLWKA